LLASLALVLASLGHFGSSILTSSHSKNMENKNQNQIMFYCPFCESKFGYPIFQNINNQQLVCGIMEIIYEHLFKHLTKEEQDELKA
jgi:hypothetical protein